MQIDKPGSRNSARGLFPVGISAMIMKEDSDLGLLRWFLCHLKNQATHQKDDDGCKELCINKSIRVHGVWIMFSDSSL